MMPTRKGFSNDLWYLLDGLWYWCLLLAIGIIMINFFENYWADLAAGLTLIFVGWLLYKVKTRNQNKLCDILFLNSYKRIDEPVLRIIPSETLQTITMSEPISRRIPRKRKVRITRKAPRITPPMPSLSRVRIK